MQPVLKFDRVFIRGIDPAASIDKLAANYPYFFSKDCEVEYGNEVALRSIVSGNGDAAADYNTDKLTRDGALLLSAYKCLLKYPVRQLVSVTWTHYYFIQYIRSLGINCDLSVHSYTDGYWNVCNQVNYKGLTAASAPMKVFGNSSVKEIGETGYLPGKDADYSDANQLQKYIPLLKEQLGYWLRYLSV